MGGVVGGEVRARPQTWTSRMNRPGCQEETLGKGRGHTEWTQFLFTQNCAIDNLVLHLLSYGSKKQVRGRQNRVLDKKVKNHVEKHRTQRRHTQTHRIRNQEHS